MLEPKLTEDQAERVYEILVNVCGYKDDKFNKRDFIFHQIRGCREYRFGGNLGWGGKFWNNDDWYVTNYREDDSDERIKIREEANEQLKELFMRELNKVNQINNLTR